MQAEDRPFPNPSIAPQMIPASWQRPPEGGRQNTHSRPQESRGTEEDPPSPPFEPIPSARRTMSVTQSHPKEGEPNIPLTISLDFYCPPQLQQQLHLAASRLPEGKQAQSAIHFPFTFRICFGDNPLETRVIPQPSGFQHPSSQMRFQLHSVVPKRPSSLPHVPVSVQLCTLTANHAVLDTAQVGVFMYWDSGKFQHLSVIWLFFSFGFQPHVQPAPHTT